MELKVINADGPYTHIALSGKLDVLGVGEIENKFIGYTAARKKNAVIDISGVTFMGSMGLRIFLSAARSLNLEKKLLILLNPQPLVNEVLEISGIQDMVVIEHDAEAALNKAKA
jgi:anti-anti-sigma factor